MPVASDIILDWIAEDGYSLSEAVWIRPQDHQFYFEVTAEKDGHRHIARAPFANCFLTAYRSNGETNLDETNGGGYAMNTTLGSLEPDPSGCCHQHQAAEQHHQVTDMKPTRTRIQTVAIACGLLCLAINAQPAMAAFHAWDITEVYSNADGTLQFIEWFTLANGEHQLAGRVVTTSSNVYTFPTNLPSSVTGGHYFLMGTVGFAALPGAPPPDFIIPDGFIDTTGDTLRLRSSPVGTIWETFSFGAGELPTDGIHSLICAVHSGAACQSTDVEVNSPTNFDGVSGSVSPCSSCPTDVDGSGNTGASDLAVLLGSWGPCAPGDACECLDDNGDGTIGAADLAVLLGSWGLCP